MRKTLSITCKIKFGNAAQNAGKEIAALRREITGRQKVGPAPPVC
jgi:hypothetical protein